MTNLLALIVELTEDAEARTTFRADPAAAVAGLDGLTGEDVEAALKVAAIQVAPDVGRRLDELVVARIPDATPREEAIAALEALCDEVELAGVISFPTTNVRHDETVVPDHPPGRIRPAHLRAVEPTDDDGGHDAPDGEVESGQHRDHPSHAPLAPVPDPPGGFEFSVLEMVLVPEGIEDQGIEPGAVGTVVAVHRDPELGYEVEISGEDGGRRFLGVLPPSAVAPVPD